MLTYRYENTPDYRGLPLAMRALPPFLATPCRGAAPDLPSLPQSPLGQTTGTQAGPRAHGGAP